MESIDTRKKIEVCFSPFLFPLFKDEFEIIVVIDVLRATSAICAAFHNGVEGLIDKMFLLIDGIINLLLSSMRIALFGN